jgi:hypothetical protein
VQPVSKRTHDPRWEGRGGGEREAGVISLIIEKGKKKCIPNFFK